MKFKNGKNAIFQVYNLILIEIMKIEKAIFLA